MNPPFLCLGLPTAIYIGGWDGNKPEDAYDPRANNAFAHAFVVMESAD